MNKIFQTDRLTIRDFTESDFQEVHDLVKEPEIYKYQHWGPNTEEDTLNFINMCVSQQSEEPRKSFEMAITMTETGQLLGAIGIRVRSYNKSDIGYWVRRDFWGKGIASEATNGLLEFGFKTLGLNKITATASPENIGSVRVLEKVGMDKEGYLKEDMLVRGEYRDSVLMGILKKDFKSGPKPQVENLVIDLEKELHSPSIRKDYDKLDTLLSDSFIEIGSSGDVYDKSVIIDFLSKESGKEITSSEYVFRELDSNTALVYYHSYINGRKSIRSSLWRKINNDWKIEFHQGTPLISE